MATTLTQGHFRFVTDDAYPGSATALAAEDAVLTGVEKNTRIWVVIGVYGGGDDIGVNLTPRLEWRIAGGAWAQVKRIANGEAWALSPSQWFADDSSYVSPLYLSNNGKTLLRGAPYCKFRSEGDVYTAMLSTDWLQAAWAIHATDGATDGASYEFRISNAGAALDTYTQTPSLTLLAVTTIAGQTTILNEDDIAVAQRIRKLTLQWPYKSGTADAGGGYGYIIDAELNGLPNDYWNGARIIVAKSIAGAAPQGEESTITDFNDAGNRLNFTNFTETATVGDQYMVEFQPPYLQIVPYVSAVVELASPDAGPNIAVDWNIRADDLYGGASLNLVIANDSSGTYSGYFNRRDIVRIEERYKSAAGTSSWVRKGTFLIWEANDLWPRVEVTAADPISLLTQSWWEVVWRATSFTSQRRR